MKTLIIYESIHHGNTRKIASAMAEDLNAKIIKASDINIGSLNEYDLIGFGSGIYYGRMHKNILKLIESLPTSQNKKVFVFSTSGQGKYQYNNYIKEKLEQKGSQVVGSFACKGYDTFGPFKLIGGIAKGRPNAEDIQNAKGFAEKILKNI